MSELTPCVKWIDDCQGKKDYDGRLISISTRYWPRGGGFHVFDTDQAAKGLRASIEDHAHIKPSATVNIVLNHGEPDEHGYGDSISLCSQSFEAETEQEVKSLVERYVAEQFKAIHRVIESHYRRAAREHGWKS